MDVLYKVLILFGVITIGVGIASMSRGYNVLASVRPTPSAWAGVGELVIGAMCAVAGSAASIWANRRR